MDFDEAICLHSKWKRRLRQTLAKHDHSLSPGEVSLDHKCLLGQWIYSEGAAQSALPEYQRLKYEHARFHTAAAELITRANAGELVDGDLEPCSNSDFSRASAGMIMAIMAIKKHLVG